MEGSMKKVLAFTLAEAASHGDIWGGSCKAAFTLAEVLITLGIIGVVAAMTLPALTANYQKRVVETKLSKFYSTISQAINLEVADEGEVIYWLPNCSSDDNNCILSWWNEHIQKHIKTLKTVTTSNNRELNLIRFADGTAMQPFINGTALHMIYCVDEKHCELKAIDNGAWHQLPMDGKYAFLFSIETSNERLKGRFVTDYSTYQEMTTEQLIEECKKTNNGTTNAGGCTTLIQRNGWKIPKNYPIKF